MDKPFLVTRAGYTYIPTTKIEESIEWYRQHLGLRLINKFNDRGSQIAVMHYPHKHAIALLLIETSDNKPLEITRNGAAFPILALNCLDIEHTYNFLKNNGVQVGELSSLGQGDARYFYFRDNEGNLLEGAWSIWDPQDEIKETFL